MKTINNGDLASLWFDSADGVADWDVPPHPRIWGDASRCFPAVLRRCPDLRQLSAVLLATHLVHRQDTPPWAKPWLAQTAPDLLGVDLSVLERIRWRFVSVPVAAGDLGRLHVVLVGAGEGAPDCSAWNARLLAEDSRRALGVARKLVRLHADQDCCFLFLGTAGQHALIEGESLGLPCYLGAMAAAEDLSFVRFLATGRLDGEGRVLPVECLSQKLDAAGDGIALFLYPEGCAAPQASGVECVAVTRVREAIEVLACFGTGLALKIAQAERALGSGQSVARELCSFHADMAGWIRRNRKRIAPVLRDDPHLEELVRQMQRWTDSTRRHDIGLGNAALDCLFLEDIQPLCQTRPRLAWDICVLHMEKASHCGDIPAFRKWSERADALRPSVSIDDDGGRQLALHYVLALVGNQHNRYEFASSLPEDPDAAYELARLTRDHEDDCRRRGPRANSALGKYYGALGQHQGFLGPAFLGQALDFLDKAMGCFCGLDGREDQDRDRLYRVFALSSANRTDEAWAGLRGVTSLWRDEAWNVEAMNPHQLHALLRLYVDAGRVMDSGLWRDVHAAWSRGWQGHPSQLIAYNLGLLAPAPDVAADTLRRSLDLCLCPASGPTIQIMALLPLARLHAVAPDVVFADQVNTALEPVRSGLLCAEHFQVLLDAPDWTDVLNRVRAHTAALFPFSYR